MFDISVLMLSAWPSWSCVRLSLLSCCQVCIKNLTHGKVCFTRFNAPSGDTFRAIWLTGGHVICTITGPIQLVNGSIQSGGDNYVNILHTKTFWWSNAYNEYYWYSGCDLPFTIFIDTDRRLPVWLINYSQNTNNPAMVKLSILKSSFQHNWEYSLLPSYTTQNQEPQVYFAASKFACSVAF